MRTEKKTSTSITSLDFRLCLLLSSQFVRFVFSSPDRVVGWKWAEFHLHFIYLAFTVHTYTFWDDKTNSIQITAHTWTCKNTVKMVLIKVQTQTYEKSHETEFWTFFVSNIFFSTVIFFSFTNNLFTFLLLNLLFDSTTYIFFDWI